MGRLKGDESCLFEHGASCDSHARREFASLVGSCVISGLVAPIFAPACTSLSGDVYLEFLQGCAAASDSGALCHQFPTATMPDRYP